MHLVIALRLFGASDNDAKHEKTRHVMIAESLGSRVESHDLPCRSLVCNGEMIVVCYPMGKSVACNQLG